MKRNGFSRIETVLAIGMTGVVAALILPSLAQMGSTARARENARRASCQSNLKQIALGAIMYTQDYDEKYPPVASSGGYFGWAERLGPYLKNREIFNCPSEKSARKDNPRAAGYTDYWYNLKMSNVLMEKFKLPSQTLMMGDGDGGSKNSNARYAIKSLPKSWLTTPGSPARRHLDGGNYSFADGHVKWFKPSRIGSKDATFAIE